MNKHEVKYNNNKLILIMALEKILKTKKINDITVSDIAKESNLARSTFYNHYDNINELYNDFLLYSFNKFKEFIINIDTNDELSRIIAILNYFKENSFFLKLFIDNSSSDIFNQFIEKYKEYICIKKTNVKSEEAYYISSYSFGGFLFLLTTWYNSNYSMSTTDLAKLIIRLNNYNE